MNHFAELRQLLQLLWRRWWLLALAGVVAGFAGYYISTLQPPRYEATASLIVGQLLHPGTIERADVQLSQQLTVAYADLARRRPVLQAVVDELGLDSWQALRSQVRTVPLESSQLLEVRAQSADPSEAEQIANELARQLVNLHALTTGAQSTVPSEVSASTLAIFDAASVPTQPVGPDIPFNTALATLVGIFFATGLVLWVELSDDRVRTPEEVIQLTDVPLLQAIRQTKGRGLYAQLVSNQEPLSAASDDYRSLRSKTTYLTKEWQRKAVVMTSPTNSWGNSLTVANLGIVLAQAGLDVIIVDGNLRMPKQHEIFQLPVEPGLTELLDDATTPLYSHIYYTQINNLSLLPAGLSAAYPSELLGSARMGELLDALLQQADVVLCDSAPSLLFPDTLAFCRHMDGLLVTVELGRTPRLAISETIANLQQVGGNLAGIITTPVMPMWKVTLPKMSAAPQQVPSTSQPVNKPYVVSNRETLPV